MVVPTADTVRFSYLLETCLDVGRSVLFAGMTGVGKSVITGAALQSLASASSCPAAENTSSSRVAGRLLAHTAVFSAQTSSSDVQYLIESKLDKKRKKRWVSLLLLDVLDMLCLACVAGAQHSTPAALPHFCAMLAGTACGEAHQPVQSHICRYGAPPGKKVVFFIDDVNMPARERYGAQPPIELLRQFQDYRGMYDRKQLFWRDIEDVTLCAACGPPGGGRQEVSPRWVCATRSDAERPHPAAYSHDLHTM